MNELDEDLFNRRCAHFLGELLHRARRGAEPGVEDVHTKHCCATHGCKYGDVSCTVTRGSAAQWYACENCELQAAEMAYCEPKADAYALSVVKMDSREAGEDGVPPLVRLELTDAGEKSTVTLSQCATVVDAKAQFSDAVQAVKLAYIAGFIRA